MAIQTPHRLQFYLLSFTYIHSIQKLPLVFSDLMKKVSSEVDMGKVGLEDMDHFHAVGRGRHLHFLTQKLQWDRMKTLFFLYMEALLF
jgi:hypothetical protein